MLTLRATLTRGVPAALGVLAVPAAAIAVTIFAAAAPAWADHVRDQQMWVLDAVRAPAAWQVSQGSGVTVAVIDSGVRQGVSDLAGSVTEGPDLTGVHTSPSNPNWGTHGTWMAALIAGHGHGPGGSDGIIGIAPKARILSIRVVTDSHDPHDKQYKLESDAQVQQALATAIRYAVTHRAKVISMSLGYGIPTMPVRKALQFALDHGSVVVASAGNSGTTQTARGDGYAQYSFPAAYPGVLGIGAVGQDSRPATFSSANLSVQVAAPGVMVPTQGRDGKYWYVNGTSPACAITAGVAALIRSKYPRLSPALVGEAITSSAVHRPPGGYDDQVGFGTVDAAAALLAAKRLALGAKPGRRGGRSAVTAGTHFGGGPAAVPAAPVRPRGAARLVLYTAATLFSLGWTLAAGVLLVRVRSRRGTAPAAAHRRESVPVQAFAPGIVPAQPGEGGWAAEIDGEGARGQAPGQRPWTAGER